MNYGNDFVPTVLWLIGPAGSGKSVAAARLKPYFCHHLDQDQLFTELLLHNGISLDFRRQNELERSRSNELRTEAALASWAHVPNWIANMQSFLIETTGDKPHNLRECVDRYRTSGYRNQAIIFNPSLEVCLQQNRNRQRVLPEDIVITTWRKLNEYLSDGKYKEIFGIEQLNVVQNPIEFDAGQWYEQTLGGRE